jgi:predicted transcriptional regulator
MQRIMSAPRTISFRIDAAKVAELDELACNMDRDRSYLLNEAVQAYLSQQRRFRAMVEEGIRAADAGDLIEDDALGQQIERWIEHATPTESTPVTA